MEIDAELAEKKRAAQRKKDVLACEEVNRVIIRAIQLIEDDWWSTKGREKEAKVDEFLRQIEIDQSRRAVAAEAMSRQREFDGRILKQLREIRDHTCKTEASLTQQLRILEPSVYDRADARFRLKILEDGRRAARDITHGAPVSSPSHPTTRHSPPDDAEDLESFDSDSWIKRTSTRARTERRVRASRRLATINPSRWATSTVAAKPKDIRRGPAAEPFSLSLPFSDLSSYLRDIPRQYSLLDAAPAPDTLGEEVKQRLSINRPTDGGPDVLVNRVARGSIQDHQIEGVRFLWHRLTRHLSGAILAHGMGLGKTMQIITLLVALAEAASSPETVDLVPKELRHTKALILCPPTLVDNWLKEITRWVFQAMLARKVGAARVGGSHHSRDKASDDEHGDSEGSDDEPGSTPAHTPTSALTQVLRAMPSLAGDATVSPKMQILIQILAEAKALGDKVVVFTQQILVLDWLETHLKDLSEVYYRLDGNTPMPDRQRRIDSFNASAAPAVFVISTKAGGLGLNIQGANRVVLFDCRYVPTHEQ